MTKNLELFFEDLNNRGIIANFANLESFYQLKSEEKVVYLGIDCTAESLHIGHLFLLIQTIRFAEVGFKVLLILGGATSKIGDPSDKSKERPQLESDQLNNYFQSIKNQVSRIVFRSSISKITEDLDFSPLESFYSYNPQLLSDIYQVLGINKEEKNQEKWKKYLSYIWPLDENKYQILNNEEWLGNLRLLDFNRFGRNITINYLLSKETIKQRIENPAAGLSYLAFSYSLLQAYDFYYLHKKYNCRGQLGGSDQWGNLTTGLELIRKTYLEEKDQNNANTNELSVNGPDWKDEEKNKSFAFTFNLLTDKEGKKISKSEGKKTLWLGGEKKEFYDFWRNLSDEQAKVYIKQFSFLKESQIEELEKLNNPPKLRIFQWILLELIWFLNYGEIKNLKDL
ncbi:MAG: Tyrosine--tRNA ligase 1 [Mycoplasmataceae bacterium]|nr:MAG: Tyrosine--tRNA ligase 1 [Mycoplasmataceae bacterium]